MGRRTVEKISMRDRLTPEMVVAGYSSGIFPMADPDQDDAIYWYRPDPRAILPLDGFHVSKNLARRIRRGDFDVGANLDFEGVVRACAGREETWISAEILDVYTQLHHMGLAHSVECRQDGNLVGGLYGVALGGAFFGESMFHSVTDASKVALVHLVRRLTKRGFTLLDVQFSTPHLAQFGVIEIPAHQYERLLADALSRSAVW